MTVADPMGTTEFAVEVSIRDILNSTEFIADNLRNNAARQSVISNVVLLGVARDRLSRILDDVGGK